MGSRLVNVRLDEERLRKARVLREQGLALSDLIREAIDERFDRLSRSRKGPDVRSILQMILEQYPDPTDLPPRGYDVRDRKAAGLAMREKLRYRVR